VAVAFVWRCRHAGARISGVATPELSGDSAQDYFADGMTEALTTDSGQMENLQVISRTSTMQYKSAKKSLPIIAHELNADAIVEGSVQRSGNRVRVTAQLIRAADDRHLWRKRMKEISATFSLCRMMSLPQSPNKLRTGWVVRRRGACQGSCDKPRSL